MRGLVSELVWVYFSDGEDQDFPNQRAVLRVGTLRERGKTVYNTREQPWCSCTTFEGDGTEPEEKPKVECQHNPHLAVGTKSEMTNLNDGIGTKYECDLSDHRAALMHFVWVKMSPNANGTDEARSGGRLLDSGVET